MVGVSQSECKGARGTEGEQVDKIAKREMYEVGEGRRRDHTPPHGPRIRRAS